MTGDSVSQSNVLVRDARALLDADRATEAALLLRRALDLAPVDAAVHSALARLWTLARGFIGRGLFKQALALLAPVAESGHASGDWLMLHAHVLMLLGRKQAAQAALRRWVAKEPDNGEAGLRLAAVLADDDKAAEAEAIARADIARRGDTVDGVFVLGRALLAQARFEQAEAAFRKVVLAKPDHPVAQGNLMELIWMRTGDVRQASRAIDRALRAQPQLPRLHITKARLLMSARMPHEALAAIEAGLASAGQDTSLLDAATTIALDFDGARAFEYAERLHALQPESRTARTALGNAALAIGRPHVALKLARRLLRANQHDLPAIAMKADALRMQGDPGYHELLDYQRLVRADMIDVPQGWADLPAYLADLVHDLEQSHVLRAHPIGNSLREGSQVELAPERSAYASIRALPQALDGPIRRYLQALGQGPHPMQQRNTGRYAFSGMWSVRLRPDGFHVNHYHPAGWISSACYMQLPPAVAGGAGEGWLKFGQPPFPTRPALEPEYFIRPEPGLLALFPSYMWHGTVPFSGAPDDHRTTIAFDVVPIASGDGAPES